jgi:hypothetical protein
MPECTLALVGVTTAPPAHTQVMVLKVAVPARRVHIVAAASQVATRVPPASISLTVDIRIATTAQQAKHRPLVLQDATR